MPPASLWYSPASGISGTRQILLPVASFLWEGGDDLSKSTASAATKPCTVAKGGKCELLLTTHSVGGARSHCAIRSGRSSSGRRSSGRRERDCSRRPEILYALFLVAEKEVNIFERFDCIAGRDVVLVVPSVRAVTRSPHAGM